MPEARPRRSPAPPQRLAARASVLFVGLALLGSLAALFVFPKETEEAAGRVEGDRARVRRIARPVRPLPAAPQAATPWFLREEARRPR